MKQNPDKTSILVAIALYKIKKSFNIFKDKSLAAWCYKINSALKILLAKMFGEVLLGEIYENIKIDVHIIVNIYTYSNYIIDGFLNISDEKIVNLSIYI